DTPLHDLFAAQAARTPDAIAVTDENGNSLTYGELDGRANQVARHLITRNVRPEQFVALVLPKTTDAIVSMLGVLKAGAAYLPVDPDYPTDRITHILTDAAPALTLTEPLSAEALTSYADTQISDEERPSPWSAHHAAYMIYTSGSTGRPKGVIIEHHALATYLHRARTAYPATSGATLLHSPLAFDLTVTALWTPLTNGGTVHLTSLENSTHQPTLIKATPSHLAILNTLPATVSPTHTMILGGEALHSDQLTTWQNTHPDTRVINAYGPTENTVNATEYRIPAGGLPVGPVPIGRPFTNTRAYVLDSALRPAAPGTDGELYLAGHQLARGYHHRSALTAERFTANPYGPPGSRMYRTGDIARWTHDGQLLFIGRADHQIKLRGHRIELGEIESAIASQPGVLQTAVLLREDQPGDQRLVAYLVPDPSLWNESDAQAGLAERLPEYMLPSAFVTLEALPLTPNGKLDRKALPAPTYTGSTAGRAPRSPREEILVSLYAEVLAVPHLTIDDSFFDLGGHSLLATRLVSRIRTTLGAELSIRQLFETPTIAALATALDRATEARTPLTAQPRPDHIPLSYAQQRLWFLHQFEGPSSTYNTAAALRLTGRLDVGSLRLAIGDVVARHESLRTTFAEDEEHGPHQIVRPADAAETPFTVVQVNEDELGEKLTEAVGHCFDLGNELPLRTVLFQVSDEEHVLLLLIHHIASDAWSRTPLAHDLTTAYTTRTQGSAPHWTPLPVQYADYALWQRQLLGNDNDPTTTAGQQLTHWKNTLHDLPEQLDLPTDRPRPPTASHAGDRITFTIPTTTHTRLTHFARTTHTSTFMLAQTALATLLTRLGAGTDIPIGTPIAGRTDDATDHLIGMFINTLVLRTNTSGNPTFRELLTRIRETDLTAYAHQDLPFERLVEALNPTRTLSHHPLFQVLLTFNNTDQEGARAEIAQLPGLDVAYEVVERSASKFDLAFTISESFDTDRLPTGISASLDFSTDLFERSSAQSIADHFVRVLDTMTTAPDRGIEDFELISAADRERVLVEWNGDDTDHADTPLHDLFAAQAARTPDAIAVTDENGNSLTYGELDGRANQVARHLIARSVWAEQFVALVLPKTTDAIVSMLGVLKAGAAYLPVDPDYPTDRITHILSDSAPALTLTEPLSAEALASYADTQISDEERLSPWSPHHAAYMIYTSGSTGRPKGVIIEHHALATYLHRARTAYPATRGTTVLHSPLAFDLTITALWTPLTNGGTVHLTSLENSLRQPTLIKATPSHLAILNTLPASASPSDTLILGGEALHADQLTTWQNSHPHTRVINAYGPTENTVNATEYRIPADGASDGPVPIGRPFTNTRAYVLDSALRPAAPGTNGELYLAGHQLARGYHHRNALTAERFTANPYGPPGSRMYRTGDIARWNHDGQLLFTGRADHQIKLRGHRIELGEIEAALTTQPGILQATVLLREDQPGDQRLVAYVVADPALWNESTVQSGLAARLPDYMLPSAFVTLEALPLTPNGKLDRKALPAPTYTGSVAGRAPRSPREEILVSLYAEVLAVPHLTIDDSFFDLGGHSLLATRLVSRIRTTLGAELSIRQLFETPTIAGLAATLDQATQVRTPLTAQPRPDHIPLSYAQQRLWFLHQLEGPSSTYNIPTTLRLTGHLDVDCLRLAIGDVVARHESLCTTFTEDEEHGPRQVIHAFDPASFFFPVVATEEAGLEAQLSEAAHHAFDLTSEIPIRASLFRITDEEHVLLLLIHHIAG
ncbi:amino acid adenylation domain-containing protein, partial [Streptomyces sp. NPDC048383]|uniref:amino acid adenylation domain-containing protein n=1 Tax=Streptomyces sp. NPDC048383 TaxID=3155386 RepID=UPI00344002D5